MDLNTADSFVDVNNFVITDDTGFACNKCRQLSSSETDVVQILSNLVFFCPKMPQKGQKQPIFPQIFGAFGAENARL